MDERQSLAEAFLFLCGMIITVVIMAVSYAVGVVVGEGRAKQSPKVSSLEEDRDDEGDADWINDPNWWKNQ